MVHPEKWINLEIVEDLARKHARLLALLEDREAVETTIFHALARYDRVCDGNLGEISKVVADRLLSYIKERMNAD